MFSIDLKRSLKYNSILKLIFCVFVIASFTLLINYGVRFTNFISYKPKTADVSDGSEFYRDYMKDFGKEYNETEFAWRLKIFLKSKAIIEELNEQSRGLARYGFNKFSDMDIAEFENHVIYGKVREKRDIGLTMFCPINRECGVRMEPSSDIVFNASITKLDWRDKGAVGPVLNQGSKCPACWAFSTVGVMESMAVIQHNVPYRRLSIQEVIDNSDEKCAMARVSSIVSILCSEQLLVATEWEYPLRLRNETAQPRPAAGWRITRMDQYCNMTPEFIMRQLQHGPVIATVNSYLWQFYLDGVIQYSCRGDMGSLIHAVQIVGYNLEAPVPYYIIRNSWGTDWGMDGYVKIAMGDFVCGIGREIISIEVAYQDTELDKDVYHTEDESDYVERKSQLLKKLTSGSTLNEVDSRNSATLPKSKDALLPQNDMTPQALNEQAGSEGMSLVITTPVDNEKLADSKDPSVSQDNTVPVVDDKARSEDTSVPQDNTVLVVDEKTRSEDASVPQGNTVPVVDEKARSEDASVPQHNTVLVVNIVSGSLETTTPKVQQTTSGRPNKYVLWMRKVLQLIMRFG